MVTAPRWVRVTSYLNVAQADLAVRQLAVEGIPAFLENAAFLSWFWHYSNATGGVKLWALDADAQRAHAVLWSWREAASVVEPPWQCSKCGELVDSTWITCWHCGASKEGEEDPQFWQEPSKKPRWRLSERTVAMIIGLSGPLVFVAFRGSLSALMVWVVAVVWLRLLLRRPAEDEDRTGADADRPSRLVVEAAEPAPTEDYLRLEETILRAWQAAVLSLGFLPLIFYSLWLLLRLTLPDAPLRPREQRRYLGAWAFDLWGLFLATFFLWFPLVFGRHH